MCFELDHLNKPNTPKKQKNKMLEDVATVR